ncbi:hypothetical protein Tco_1523814 [Tanacetum coccineum]
MGILLERSIGARCSPKPDPIPVGDLIGASLRVATCNFPTVKDAADVAIPAMFSSIQKGIEVNAGDSKLMLLGINLLLLGKVNAARHNLLLLVNRDGNETRTRWGPDPQTRIDWGIPELTGDGDEDEESPNYEIGDGAGMGIT